MPRAAPIRQAGIGLNSLLVDFFVTFFLGEKDALFIYPNFNIDGRKGETFSSQNLCRIYIYIYIYRQFPMICILSCKFAWGSLNKTHPLCSFTKRHNETTTSQAPNFDRICCVMRSTATWLLSRHGTTTSSTVLEFLCSPTVCSKLWQDSLLAWSDRGIPALQQKNGFDFGNLILEAYVCQCQLERPQ